METVNKENSETLNNQPVKKGNGKSYSSLKKLLIVNISTFAIVCYATYIATANTSGLQGIAIVAWSAAVLFALLLGLLSSVLLLPRFSSKPLLRHCAFRAGLMVFDMAVLSFAWFVLWVGREYWFGFKILRSTIY
jgi:hypothetical protein